MTLNSIRLKLSQQSVQLNEKVRRGKSGYFDRTLVMSAVCTRCFVPGIVAHHLMIYDFDEACSSHIRIFFLTRSDVNRCEEACMSIILCMRPARGHAWMYVTMYVCTGMVIMLCRL